MSDGEIIAEQRDVYVQVPSSGNDTCIQEMLLGTAHKCKDGSQDSHKVSCSVRWSGEAERKKEGQKLTSFPKVS